MLRQGSRDGDWVLMGTGGGELSLLAHSPNPASTPFAEVLTERLFRPAGMTTARLLADQAVIPWRARGYEAASGGAIAAARHLSWTITGGAGGLAASLDDIVAFDQALRDHRLGGPELESQLTTPVWLGCGRAEGYGLGWVLTSYRGYARGQPRRGHQRLLQLLRPVP